MTALRDKVVEDGLMHVYICNKSTAMWHGKVIKTPISAFSNAHLFHGLLLLLSPVITGILYSNINYIKNRTLAFHQFITCCHGINWTVTDIPLLKDCLEKSQSASRFEINHREHRQSTVRCGHCFVRCVQKSEVPSPSDSDSFAPLQTAKLYKDNHVQR